MMMNAKINNTESRTFLLVHIVTLMYLAVTNRITIPFVEIGIAVRDTIRFMKRGYYQSSGERRNAMSSSDRKFPSLSQVRHVLKLKSCFYGPHVTGRNEFCRRQVRICRASCLERPEIVSTANRSGPRTKIPPMTEASYCLE